MSDQDQESVARSVAADDDAPVTVSPKIGGVYKNYQWTGGKPSAEWNGTEIRSPESPFCFRFDDPSKQLKNYSALTTCTTQKFKRNDAYTLPSFLRDVIWHMKHVGMDSIFYFINPANDKERLSILTYHSRFSGPQITSQIQDSREYEIYDQFDEANLKMSYVWFLNALDETLLSAIRPQFRKT